MTRRRATRGAPALLLDRDGVLNRDREDFIRSLDHLVLIPGAIRAAADLSRHGIPVVVVSNQSGIARGYLTAEVARAIMDRVRSAIEDEGGRVAGIYQCPHGPADGCDCRKPRPGLLLRAAADLGLDLRRSIVVGDSERDIAAGRAAGVAATVLVLSGKTRAEGAPWTRWATPPDDVAEDLEAAAPAIRERLARREVNDA